MTAPEVPDWTRPVSVMGKDSEGNPVTVLLDSLGRLICVLYGAITLSGPVDVTQVDSTREIQGADGVTLHTIAVDSEGRIIALIKGMHDSTPTNVAVDASGQMITVPRGQSGNYLLVDADGFMAALMKGLYAGTTLKTCAVDSEGRMIMIPTDPADIWGNAISMGNAELVARMTGLGGFDRRGNAIFCSSFENGLNEFMSATSGTSGAVELSTAKPRVGAYCVLLTAGSTVGKYALLGKTVAYPVLSKFGGEIAFTWSTSIDSFIMEFYFYSGVQLAYFQVVFSETDSKIYYYKNGGGFTEIDDLPNWATDTNLYHIAKLVVDLATQEYVRLIVDNTEYPLTDISGNISTDYTRPYLTFRIANVGPGATNPSIYVDAMIITQNEPANA